VVPNSNAKTIDDVVPYRNVQAKHDVDTDDDTSSNGDVDADQFEQTDKFGTGIDRIDTRFGGCTYGRNAATK